ncbi:MAG: sugar ABC transporter permease [bacterium]|nr:sugar ABC transporter permease [bacterium]
MHSSERRGYFILALPAIIIYGFVIIIPLLYTFFLSFTNWAGFGAPKLIGLQNYLTVFADPVFWFSIRNNLLIVVVSVCGQVPLGFFMAYLLYRKIVAYRGFFESMLFLPSILSPVVVGILFSIIFAPTGLIAMVIKNILGVPTFDLVTFLDRETAIIPYLIVILWMYTGMYMIIFTANLQKISVDLLEAATLEGASELQTMRYIILPLMVNTFFICSIYAIAGSLKGFELLWVMTRGGPSYYTHVLGIYMMNTSFTYYKYGLGSTLAIILILSSVLLITGLQRIAHFFGNKYE